MHLNPSSCVNTIFHVSFLPFKAHYSKALRRVLNLSIWAIIIFLDLFKYCPAYILFLIDGWLWLKQHLIFVPIREKCWKNVQLSHCWSWQARGQWGWCADPSAFSTQEKTLPFSANSAGDFIARRASQAMCILAVLRWVPNSQNCSHSLRTCCRHSHTHCMSQGRAEAYPSQLPVWTSLERRCGFFYWAPEKASLPAAVRISSPLSFLH